MRRPLPPARATCGVRPRRLEHRCWSLLPSPDDPDAIGRAVPRWRAAAYGRRPVDHVGRDLLFGSLGRDHRARSFRRLCRDPPDWVREAVDLARGAGGLVAPAGTLVRHLVLRSLRERHLAQLLLANRGYLRQRHHDLLNALYACRPVGLLLEWAGPADRAHDFRCGRARACPWCLARKVVALYRRLRAGPCDPARAGEATLVLVKARVDDDVVVDGDGPEILTPGRVERVLDAWRPWLLDYARRLGMVGGLTYHQVGPGLARAGGNLLRGFRHEVGVLGEVACRLDDERLRRLAGFDAMTYEQALGTELDEHGQILQLEVTAMPMATRSAARWLLAGSPAYWRYDAGGAQRVRAAWVARIVRNAVADGGRHDRAGRRDRRDRPGSTALARLARGSSPERRAARQEDAVRLAAALERLPEHQREVLRARFFEGLSFAEIGERTGKSEGALRVVCLRAIDRLRPDEQLRHAMGPTHDGLGIADGQKPTLGDERQFRCTLCAP
jgi:RNA polymerase sigma factor (sigma-70 family)